MDIGKIVRVIPVQEPQRREIRYYPQVEPNRFLPEPEEQPIPVPEWPIKIPEKVDAE